MSLLMWAGALAAAGLMVYLVVALLNPEAFS